MANNCLVTTLIGSANNANLKKLDELWLRVTKNSTGRNRITGVGVKFELVGDPQQVYFSDSTYSQNNGQTVTAYDDELYIVNNTSEDAVLKVINYRKIKKIFTYDHQSNVNLQIHDDGSWLQYIDDAATEVSINSSRNLYYVDTQYLKNKTSLTRVKLWYYSRGDISNLGGLTNLTELSINTSYITGDIASLSRLTKLTNINCSNTITIGGKTESFLKGILDNKPDRSARLTFNFVDSSIKIKGSVYNTYKRSNYYADFNSGTISVYYSGDSSLIAQYDGTHWKDENGNIYVP